MGKSRENTKHRPLSPTDPADRARLNSARPRCLVCGNFKDGSNPRCICNSGGGARKDGAAKTPAAPSNADAPAPKLKPTLEALIASFGMDLDDFKFVPEKLSHPSFKHLRLPFDPEAIYDLLFRNALFIHNNKEQGILTIQLRYPAQQQAYRNFVDAILDNLEQFLEKHHLTQNKQNYLLPDKRDDKGNVLSFRIHLPEDLYAGFIAQLAQKQLLPVKVIQQKTANEKLKYEENINPFNLKPFSTKLLPTSGKKAKEQEAELAAQSHPRARRTGKSK